VHTRQKMFARALIMISDAPIKGMNVLLGGNSSTVEQLYGWFVNRPGGGETWFVGSAKELFEVASHNRIHLILLEPSIVNWPMTALKLREISPEAVISFLGDDNWLDIDLSRAGPEVKQRLSHYYRVRYDSERVRSVDVKSLEQLLKDTAAWHAKFVSAASYPPRYEYDVAISFAGEDREVANSLARFLKDMGLHVFFDDFERARLWGKDLFTTLYEVYSSKARYCIILISKAYVDRQWTVHERRAAQERVLSERDNEYLLPVRIDDTPLPGLPRTVAYLDISIGVDEVALLFMEKLATALARQSSFRTAR
jgi:hypothetical protein